jgi:hypothetical protein
MSIQDWQQTGAVGSSALEPPNRGDDAPSAIGLFDRTQRKALPSEPPACDSPDPAYWPPEARMILSALEAAESTHHENRRATPRTLYQVQASLYLFSDPDGSPAWKLYTRDVSSRSLGFLTPHRLPLGYGGIVELPGPDGKPIRAHCTLFRCRQTARGWYEGALSFHRKQWALAGESPSDETD